MRLLVMDGNSIANRAFYGVRALTTKDGLYTNALFGFLNILDKLKERVQPQGIAVAFDVHAPTFRHEMYGEYKAGRKGMPEELRCQMPLLKELLPLLGCTVIEKAGYEADDILGTLAKACAAQGGTCYIATGDRDALQLVDDEVTVLLATTKMGEAETVTYDAEAIRQKYGLTPSQMIDLKALMGDASDHIPGVPGVGEKTALDLLYRYGSLDELYRQEENWEMTPSLKRKLTDGKESAYLSRTLGTICTAVPIETAMAAYELKPMQSVEVKQFLLKLEFFKILKKWGLDGDEIAVPTEPKAEPVPTLRLAASHEVIAQAKATGEAAVYGVFDKRELTALWLAAGEIAAQFDRLLPDFNEALQLLADETVRKITHGGKTLYTALLEEGVTPAGFVGDTELAAYLLNPLASDYTMPRLLQEYGVAVNEGEVSPEIAGLVPLWRVLDQALETQQQKTLFTEMELPLSLVLADMERLGFEVDGEGIAAFGKTLGHRIETLSQDIYDAVGYAFNLNSPKQLGKALFEDLQLPAKKKTKSGYSTNAEVLESLRDAHPVVGMLLDYRMLSKLKSTYCDGLLKEIAPDGRIHSSFNQTETRTGRISSTEPNLQNIPVRSELGRELRRFFRAKEGYVLCDADYSQIELRVLAHMAADPTMMQAFNTGEDIHRSTAVQVFGVPEAEVTPLMRSRAKAVNFGIVYGIGAHSLSEDIGVSYREAKQYIEDYMRHFGAVTGFMERKVNEAREQGYTDTLFGRRRPLPELRAGNAMTRSFGERVARNTPIQGTAADIIKLAMIRVYDRLRRENRRARLLLQVHDELIVEAPLDEAETVAQLLKEEMESAAKLSVKLAVDVHVGQTWFEAKG